MTPLMHTYINKNVNSECLTARHGQRERIYLLIGTINALTVHDNGTMSVNQVIPTTLVQCTLRYAYLPVSILFCIRDMVVYLA